MGSNNNAKVTNKFTEKQVPTDNIPSKVDWTSKDDVTTRDIIQDSAGLVFRNDAFYYVKDNGITFINILSI